MTTKQHAKSTKTAAPTKSHAADKRAQPKERAIDPQNKVEGEGSYTAARRYDAGVAKSIARGDTERLANEAAKALDGPEGAELAKAEAAAKHSKR